MRNNSYQFPPRWLTDMLQGMQKRATMDKTGMTIGSSHEKAEEFYGIKYLFLTDKHATLVSERFEDGRL